VVVVPGRSGVNFLVTVVADADEPWPGTTEVSLLGRTDAGEKIRWGGGVPVMGYAHISPPGIL
jgi:hypothetical protein